ncbi:MAG: FG-GAP-like repeat-containing protein [Verrucomicrobiota bacterium]
MTTHHRFHSVPSWLTIQPLTILALSLSAINPTVGTAQPIAGASFTRITAGAIVTEARFSAGCSWTDYNQDGFLDLFVCHNRREPNSLFLNDRAGGFIAGPAFTETAEFSLTPVWADFDNDGFPDLFVANNNVNSWFYRNSANGNFSRLTSQSAGSIANHTSLAIVASSADFDNDGHLDLFIANGGLSGNQRNTLYRNRGDGRFESLPSSVPCLESMASMAGTWVDYDNDGDADLFVTNARQANSLFRNNGDGTFSKVTTGPIVTDVADHFAASWADYDNDGDADLFITNAHFGPVPNSFYRNRGDGTFERLAIADVTTRTGEFLGSAWGDYDNDGYLDLFVCDRMGGNNLLYRNRGDGTFERIVEAGGPGSGSGTSTDCAWGDYDNDGFLDLFVSNGDWLNREPDLLYRNTGNANRWLKLLCIGTMSNRSAIGARLRAKVVIEGSPRWLTRDIFPNFGAQGFSVVHFGLGDAVMVERLEIFWPSGLVQNLNNVSPNQTLRVVEPARIDSIRKNADAAELSLHGGKGRTYRIERSANLTGWTPIGLTTIVNANGLERFNDTESPQSPQQFYRAALAEMKQIAAFNPATLPEGLTIDPQGNMYVSMIASGEIRKITPDGTPSTFAQLPETVTGMAADRQGAIYVAASPQPPAVDRFGIWKIESNGQARLFAPMPPDTLINDLFLHANGNLYVTDSIGGKVFQISQQGTAQVWTTDPLLLGTPDPQPPHPPFPIGANGIAFFRTNAFVANTDLGTLVRIPVQADGSAGVATVFSQDARLFGADGVVSDLVGNLYVANIIQNTIVKVTPEAHVTVIADVRDGLDGPSSLRFGTRLTERSELFIVNYAFLSAVTGGTPKPSLMKLPVAISGVSIP